MSAKSDAYEKEVADAINKIPGVTATRPSVGSDYSDIKITQYAKRLLSPAVWIEVKMSHSDNLANPRVFYEDVQWKTTYTTPASIEAVKLLNKSDKANKFISDISKFSGIPERIIKIPTTKGGLAKEGAVPLKIMKMYFDQPGINRYILDEKNFNLGDMVTKHYTQGKTEAAYYMQAGDDFYMISNKNPLKFSGVPVLNGKGDFKMRISTRSEFYEVQPEIKIKEFIPSSSAYSVKPGTKKINPFYS